MLLSTVIRLLHLIRQVVLPSRFPGIRRYLHRMGVMLLFLPVLITSQLLSWLALGLDEIMFPGYRRVHIQRPVIVLGVPRSGTTFMHRLLAAGPDCTTFSTWECLLAPSITQRYFWSGLAALDRLVGRPFARLLQALEGRMLARTGNVHPTGLFEPEEDFYCFMPLLSCFILVLPFPDADWVWRMAKFDSDLTEQERKAYVRWYHRCLQRHLYFHGPEKRFLSKNASFAGMAGSLAAQYPDCSIVICERDTESVIRSQFRSIALGMRFFATRPDDPDFRDRLLDCIAFYSENLRRIADTLGSEQVLCVPLESLSTDTRRVMETICMQFDLTRAGAIDRAVGEYESACEAARA